MNKELDVIVPVKNESGNITELARRIHAALNKAGISYQLIFVDDYSTDSTATEVLNLSNDYPITLHKKQGKPGKGYAILEGAAVSTAHYVAMIDGDLQYPPEALPELFAIAKEHGVAVANRVTSETGKLRKLASKVNSLIFGKMLMGLTCDAQSGLKVFNREIIDHLDPNDIKPWAIDVPLLKTAQDLGYTIGHTQIEFKDRAKGQSKINLLKATSEITTTSLKHRIKRSKVYSTKVGESESPIGSGVAYKKRRFTTHTHLPHKKSALITFSPWQKLVGLTGLSLLIVGALINPLQATIFVIALLTAIYFIDTLFSFFVLTKSLHFPPEISPSLEDLASLQDRNLPIYTILCPLYKEGKVLPHFVESVSALDWPKHKLDVQILLEEDDTETLAVAKKLNLPGHFRIIIVPDSNPRTKPKACNYGLAHAKGEYVVIYDAEDTPDPLQLKKSFFAFQNSADNVVCLQSKLNYYNPNHNLLTRLFTAEYSLWFDIILPGLQSIDTHIPLGGTSNHFKTSILKKLHAWDSFNVTEDCDLGVRLYQEGYKTAIVDSVTLEEANSNAKNWIRQRSRWIKGYLQTYLVHMRDPISFVKNHGIHALIFQLVIGMRMVFMVINPILWTMTILYFAAYQIFGPTIESLYPSFVFYFAVFSLIFGNFMYIYIYMIGAAKRGHWGVIKYVLLIPFYWVMASLAAVMAIYQLITKPHYWEKTNHGLHLSKDGSPREGKQIRRLAADGLAGGGVLVAAGGAASFLNLLYNAYLGRVLQDSDFGSISLIGNLFAVSAVATGAIGRTVTYKSAYLFGKINTPVKSFWRQVRLKSFLFGLLLMVVWVTLIPFMMDFFQVDSALPFFLFSPIWVLGYVSSVDNGFLKGSLKFTQISVLVLAEAIVKLASVYLLVENGLDNWAYAAIPLSLLLSLVLGWMFIYLIDEPDKEVRDDTSFPSKFFGASVLTKFSTVSFLSADIILAKHLLTPEAAGQYALLSLSGKIVYFLGSLFVQFVDPIISKQEGAGKNSRGTFYKLLSLVTLASYSGFVVIGLLGFLVTPFIFGEKAVPITPYLPVYAFGMAGFTVATAIVHYHQIKHHYLFPVVAFLIALAEIFLVGKSGTSIEAIATTIGILGSVYLLTVLTLHFSLDFLLAVGRNIKDFFDLFNSKGTGVAKNGSQKARILIFNWRDTKHVWAGGAEVYVHEIAKRWVAAGHKVTLFCGNDGKSKRHELIEGVNIVRRGGFYTVYFWAAVYYVLRFRDKFDVIVESENGVPFFTPLYARIPKYLLTHHVHQDVFRNHLSMPLAFVASMVESRLKPLVYRNQKIITVSQSTKNDLSKLGISGNISIVNPAVYEEQFKKTKKTAHPSFIYIGRHKPYKNIDVAIKAFAKVYSQNTTATLIIAGEGEGTKALIHLAQELGISQAVKFTGKVSEAEKTNLLGQSWAAIQPSSFEGWGITVIEANAAATPVIASKVNGLSDSVLDGKTGILVPLRDINAFADAMSTIIKSPKKRTEMSAEAYKWAKKFSWQKSADQFLEIVTQDDTDKSKFSIATRLA